MLSQVLVIYLMAQTTSKWVAAPLYSYLHRGSVGQVAYGSSLHPLQQGQVLIRDDVAAHPSQTVHYYE